jgi:hypothetical protein
LTARLIFARDHENEGGAKPPSLICGSPGKLDRQNRDDPHVVRIDDDQFILVDEIEETTPSRLNIHEHRWHRHDVDTAARNDRPNRQVEVDVADPRRAVRADDPLPDPRALFVREGDMGARGIALETLHAATPRPVFGNAGAGGARAACRHAAPLLGLRGSAPFKVALVTTVHLLGLLSLRGRAYALWRRGLSEAFHALGRLLGGRFSASDRLLHPHLLPGWLGILTHVSIKIRPFALRANKMALIMAIQRAS